MQCPRAAFLRIRRTGATGASTTARSEAERLALCASKTPTAVPSKATGTDSTSSQISQEPQHHHRAQTALGIVSMQLLPGSWTFCLLVNRTGHGRACSSKVFIIDIKLALQAKTLGFWNPICRDRRETRKGDSARRMDHSRPPYAQKSTRTTAQRLTNPVQTLVLCVDIPPVFRVQTHIRYPPLQHSEKIA